MQCVSCSFARDLFVALACQSVHSFGFLGSRGRVVRGETGVDGLTCVCLTVTVVPFCDFGLERKSGGSLCILELVRVDPRSYFWNC